LEKEDGFEGLMIFGLEPGKIVLTEAETEPNRAQYRFNRSGSSKGKSAKARAMEHLKVRGLEVKRHELQTRASERH
jgi:hypothetical protein